MESSSCNLFMNVFTVNVSGSYKNIECNLEIPQASNSD